MDLLNLPSLKVLSVNEDGGDYLVSAEAAPPTACPHDGGPLVGFGRRPQEYADLPIHGKKVRISISRRRWRCKQCEKVTLDPLPDMDDKRAATTRLVEYVRRESLRRTFVSIAEEVGILINTVRGMNQTELAKATGISQPQVSRIKRGEDNASADTVRDLAKALGVPQVVALIEAGYITDLSPELAALAAEVERLPDVERRAVIGAIAGMVSALCRREQR